MKNLLTAAAFAALLALASPSARAGEAGGGEDGGAIDRLKKILQKMEVVEKLLAKTRVDRAGKEQEKVLEELKKQMAEGKVKEDEILSEVDKQLEVVLKRMKDIDDEIQKIIDEVELSKSEGGGGMDMEPKDGSESGKKSEEQKRKEERERELKKLRGEEEEKKTGEQSEGNEGNDPAKKPYEAKGSGPDRAPPRAEGTGRWGDLPLKEFEEALASGKVDVPEKYRALIQKYLEMLTKKANE